MVFVVRSLYFLGEWVVGGQGLLSQNWEVVTCQSECVLLQDDIAFLHMESHWIIARAS